MAAPRRRVVLSAVGMVLALLAVRSRSEAVRPAPILPAQIPATERGRLEPIVRQAAVATRMDYERYPARPAVFEYLLDHPEFASQVTRAVRAGRYRIWRSPEGLALDDGWGVHGHFELVHAAPGMRVFFAQGQYESRMLPDIPGRAVVIIEYAFQTGRDGRSTVATSVTAHVALDGKVVRLAGQTAGPVAQGKADKEGRRLLRVFSKVCHAIEDSPQAVYEAVRAQPDVPRAALEEFRRLLLRVP